MSSITGSGGIIRLDTSRMNEYLYADKPKLNFMQKLGRGFGKALSFLGPIGAAVTAIAVPGIGLPIAAGIYGLSSAAGTLTQRAQAKDAYEMQTYQQQVSQLPVMTPGLFEQAPATGAQTDFIVPTELKEQTELTILNRESAQNGSVEGFNFY
ncbi:MAG TPA: hypothetical protein VJC18_09195 [bacterium]|nr:hypothetical protein [bacterium]